MEDSKARYKRYMQAVEKYDLVSQRLEEIYRYFAPSRVSQWSLRSTDKSAGQNININYDSTPQEALLSYANNVQAALMPPYKQWHSLDIGDRLDIMVKNDDLKQQIRKQLQEINDRLFDELNQSNYYLATNEAFIDMGISTGIVFIDVNCKTFNFKSVPLNAVVFDESSATGTLDNFWYMHKTKAREILEVWPDAKLTAELERKKTGSPDEELFFIEGCIYYPDEKGTNKYLYYVQYNDGGKEPFDIYSKWLSFNPYTGFRGYKTSGETWGRGKADTMLSHAKLLQKLVEFQIKSAKFAAYPVLGMVGSPTFNPNTLKFNPGSIINMPQPNALQPLNFGGKLQYTEEYIQIIQRQIMESFFSNPLGNVATTKDRTASEMQIRQQQWMQQNAVSMGRLENECIRPILHKCLIVLREKGLIRDITINDEQLNIGLPSDLYKFKFESPLIGFQASSDMQQMDNYIQRIMNLYGPTGLQLFDNVELPIWYAEKSDIPVKLIKNKSQIGQVLQGVQDQLKKQQQQIEEEQLQKQAQQAPQPLQQQDQMREMMANVT